MQNSEGEAAQGGPIAVYGNRLTFEIAPVLLAAERHYPGGTTVLPGGVPNLIGEAGWSGAPVTGRADVATHAETQVLRHSVRHPELRLLLTVTEGLYRLVARRSAGIARLADLRGKRIATAPETSAGFFLARLLAQAGLSYGEIEAVPILPLTDMATALAEGHVDAVAIWEPHLEAAARAIGADAMLFDGAGIYRERFGLNTTAASLADPVMRGRIVTFVRAILRAAADIRHDPTRARQLVCEASGYAPELVARSWPRHAFVATLGDDLLDLLVEEDAWLAARAGRPARSRNDLAPLIDRSVLDEARRTTLVS